MYQVERESGDIVINGWEQGIAPSPHKGIGNIQCGDISTIPGEVMANYGRARQSQVKTLSSSVINPDSGNTLSVVAGTLVSSGVLQGTWIIVSASSITGLATGNYYVKSASGSIIQIAATFEGTTITGLGLTGTATFTVQPMGKPVAWTSSFSREFPNYDYFVLDSNLFVWQWDNAPGTTTNRWRMIAHNLSDKITNMTGIVVYGSYLVGVADSLYYKSIANDSGLGAAWTVFNNTCALSHASSFHSVLLGNDQVVYWTDDYNIGSLTVVAGVDASSFNPSTASGNWTFTQIALALPETQVATCLAELGTNLAIGTYSNNLYFWNRTPVNVGGGGSTVLNSFFFPVFLPERWTQSLVTVNNLLYVFCGNKGNIYITNGTTVSTVITIPDSVTGQVEPYYVWGGTMYLRGRLWFSVQDSNNKTGGIWSFVPQQNFYIEHDTGAALRLEAQNSYDTYAGMATLLFSVLDVDPATLPSGQAARGAQYWAAWDDGTAGASSNPYGIDFSNTTPGNSDGTTTTQGQTSIETDIIPTGEILGKQKKTFTNIEFKLAVPLVAGESVTINYRTNLSDAFASAGTTVYDHGNSVGALSGYISPVLFQNTQWIQLQAVLSSTTSSPSFVRLKELRLRVN